MFLRIGRQHGALGPVIVALCAMAAWGALPTRPAKAPNPHWNRDSCGQCHLIQDGKPITIPRGKVDEVCLSCHDGVKASYEFHPVGRAFDRKRFSLPQNWPMVDDRLGCATCHDMRPACSQKIERPALNRMLLREFRSAGAQTQPFCRKCHVESSYKKLNPHQMMLADKDEVIEEKCLFCHDKSMDRKAMARSGKAQLKTDQASMCRDCHPQHKDAMQQGHIGMKLSAEMLAFMSAREITGLNSTLGQQVIDQVKAAGGKPTRMVSGPDGTIVCSTCHNPHQAGVFPLASVLAYRAMKPNDKGELVSPVRGQKWCRHCHEF